MITSTERKDGYTNDPFLLRWGPFLSLAFVVLLAYGSGMYWLSALRSDHDHLRDNVINLQTPLSARVFASESAVAEIGRRQAEVRERLGLLEKGGTPFGNAERVLLKRDVETLKVEIAGQDARCLDFNRRLEVIQAKHIEMDVMLRNIIELLNPHSQKGRGKTYGMP